MLACTLHVQVRTVQREVTSRWPRRRDNEATRCPWKRASGIRQWLNVRYSQMGMCSIRLVQRAAARLLWGVTYEWSDYRWFFFDWHLIRAVLAVSRDIIEQAVFIARICSLQYCTIETVNARTTPRNFRFCDFAAWDSYGHVELQNSS